MELDKGMDAIHASKNSASKLAPIWGVSTTKPVISSDIGITLPEALAKLEALGGTVTARQDDRRGKKAYHPNKRSSARCGAASYGAKVAAGVPGAYRLAVGHIWNGIALDTRAKVC